MSTSHRVSNIFRGQLIIVISIVIALLVAAVLWATYVWSGRRDSGGSAPREQAHGGEDEHGHEKGHEHAHAGHSEASSIKLSQNGLKNVGYRPVTVELTAFERTETIPAIVVEQPGRTQIRIVAPMGGVITKINVVAGQAVQPGSAMFEVRLIHEELVTAQQEYLRTVESLDVVNREITRLRSFAEGVVAGRRILEQEYEKQKLEASLRAGEQALLLHGLDEAQVRNILQTRKLLQSLTIFAPPHTDNGNATTSEHWFHVQNLPVSLGQQVESGQELCVLADHYELLVEGRAFEDDATRLRQAAREGWNVTASLLVGEKDSETVKGLKVLYVSDRIDLESRAFHFYLRLPNEIVLDQRPSPGVRYIEWRFKPGQRMELRVPVERWEKRIVVPVDAVVDEGAEMYVYRMNGDHFDRVPVTVEYRDRNSAVIANDGSLFPGDIIAGKGAYQMHLDLKNKAGGGVDPHAGHNH